MININMDSHTRELVELSEDYRVLFCRMWFYNYYTKHVIKCFTSELSDAEAYKAKANSFSEYFYKLRCLDMETFKSQLSMFSDHLKKRILEQFEVIDRVSKKYGIDNLDELFEKIMELWNECHINNDTFKKNIVLVVSSYYDKKGYKNIASKTFTQIYLDMAKEGVLDPMQPIGASFEQLYIMMPIAPEFYDANFKVLSSPIDWQLCCNGSKPLDRIYFDYARIEDDSFDKKYYYDVILHALKSDCCVFDNAFRYHHYSTEVSTVETSYDAITRRTQDIKSFKDMLADPEIFNHQLELYRGHENPNGDANIEEVKKYIAQKRLVKVLEKISNKKVNN